jgi:orotidine-5'-phosphate decarboxylase
VNHLDRPLIAAIDTSDRQLARRLIRAVGPFCGFVKLGLEFYLAHGPAGLDVAEGARVFLDLKLHDIPHTVAGAVRSLLPLEVDLITIHACGGAAMVAAAREAAEAAQSRRPLILAVTVLTSISDTELAGIGVSGGVGSQVERLARLALGAGADGLICAAHEVRALRATFGTEPLLVVPGIRPSGFPSQDQARVTSPQEAIRAGADHIVVGRPITSSPDPARAAAEIAALCALR